MGLLIKKSDAVLVNKTSLFLNKLRGSVTKLNFRRLFICKTLPIEWNEFLLRIRD